MAWTSSRVRGLLVMFSYSSLLVYPACGLWSAVWRTPAAVSATFRLSGCTSALGRAGRAPCVVALPRQERSRPAACVGQRVGESYGFLLVFVFLFTVMHAIIRVIVARVTRAGFATVGAIMHGVSPCYG